MRKRNRIAATVFSTATALALLAGCATKPEGVVAPTESVGDTNKDGNYNILFITTDQEHYFSEYPEGNEFKARQLLAELGTTFEKHYACSNMSTSSRSVIYTGTHITDTEMLDNTDFAWQKMLDSSLTTVGDRMREAGYYSAYKGKWHMGDSSIISDAKSQLTDLEEYGFSDWGGTDHIGIVHEGNQVDPQILSETVAWLDGTGRRLNAEGRSFFLSVNMVNPHDIMNYDTVGYQSNFLSLADAPADALYDKTYPDAPPSTWNFNLDAQDVPDALRMYRDHWNLFSGPITDEAVWKDYQDYYYNCIQDNDDSLMGILAYLQVNGMLDNTIIVFTSDHGEMHGSHGLKGKGGFLYENNVHVPLVIVHPEYEGGKRVSAVTSHIDLAPTFIDMTNIAESKKAEISKGLAGHSLLDLMDGSNASIRDGSLLCYEMLSMTALQFGVGKDGDAINFFDTTKRGMVRGIVTY